MHYAQITDIIIKPNRQRREFDPSYILELAESFEKTCMLHAVIVREEEGKLVLVAGENRIKAATVVYELNGRFKYAGKYVPHGCIPYVAIGELSELEAEEAELEENLRRRDLTWQEKAAATERLDKLRRAQKGTCHTPIELALEIKGRADGPYLAEVKADLILAKHLDNPMVSKAKNADEALKFLKAEERKKTAIGRAEEFSKRMLTSKHKLLEGDCLVVMEQLLKDGKRFDVILTDPPYGMNAQSFGHSDNRLSTITHEYDDSPEHWRQLMSKWVELSYALAKDEAHAYVFCDIERYSELKLLMESAGWYVHRTPIIYYKTDGGRVPLPDIGPRRCWEMCLYAIKGKRRTTGVYPDVVSAVADSNLGHGAQKPIACFQNLLQRSVLPGDSVLDTFCGTGTIFPAAQTLKCIATGIELDKVSFGIAAKRLEEIGE